MEYSPKKMTQTIEKENFHFKKKFGQNFIVDENIIDAIIKKAEINKNVSVMEIGPGAGSLTYKLASTSKEVLCYEIDETVKPILEENLKEFKNVKIIYEDFLKADVKKEIQAIKNTLYVVSNLPYYITTPIIMKIIEDRLPVTKMIFMVQKEVGDRFKASVGTKDYNSLTIYLNYYFTVRKILDVSRNVFMPKPNVDSIVLEFTKKNCRPNVKEEIFFPLVRDSFRQKRKTLRNNLKNYNLKKIEEVLHSYGYDLNVRAENLSMEIFIAIANAL